MIPDVNYIVLVVSESNLNCKVDGPGFEDIESAVAHAEGITKDPQQRLTVAYIVPVDAVVVKGQDIGDEEADDE